MSLLGLKDTLDRLARRVKCNGMVMFREGIMVMF